MVRAGTLIMIRISVMVEVSVKGKVGIRVI